jgi:hypothetical protein
VCIDTPLSKTRRENETAEGLRHPGLYAHILTNLHARPVAYITAARYSANALSPDQYSFV